MADIILPPKYYLEHFEDFITSVKTHQSHLMEESHKRYLLDFAQLSEDAKCLLIRMINRSGKIFSKTALIYDEISDYENSWQELFAMNFVTSLGDEDLDDYFLWLKKDDHKNILSVREVPFKKSSSKQDYLNLVLGLNLKVHDLSSLENIVVLNRLNEIEYLLFLYFGRLEQKLILPTLRDLGIRQANKKGSLSTKFKTLLDAQTSFFYAQLKRRFKKEKLAFTKDEILTWPKPTSFESRETYEDLVLKSANLQETDEDKLHILNFATYYPASIQRVRLLHQLGFAHECQRELERMMDDPFNDEELLFAEDFLLRKFHKKKLSLLTETLRNAEKIYIDESFYRHPEFGVLSHYETMGLRGHFAENYLWSTLFWTFFQEEIDQSAHSEFDHAPAELKEKTFLKTHEVSIGQKFKSTDKEKLKELFPEDEIILDFIDHAPLSALFDMLTYLAEDYYGRSSGFPDLYLIREGEVEFIEIKAEGDSLKPSQIKQMRQLEKLGFKVKVLQVGYQFNENQTYVVVDLETTGSVSSWNRITEIGAVKVRNNQVIETFQTLINPERSIPQNIQELTGITNAMVKDAPLFKDVAQKFLAFVDGSIFVAHNAGFDYSFIQNEFKRMEESFVMPYICTKSWMKKYYPGLESYGLKKLCETFRINLETHHRALCDAEAASELLKLINEKRKPQA